MKQQTNKLKFNETDLLSKSITVRLKIVLFKDVNLHNYASAVIAKLGCLMVLQASHTWQ